ncbi:protein transport protein Sec31A isoform X4 [Takifugu flavidus]|uniref:protein transport protein Sec31A isoform X4 n=1 Tax=Takifugu flavidus TaxID=433684 RepID=UPI002544CE75|nr:protein transport protein Sec31A isoform X4 [Takifugu flavidus]
MKLKEIKRTAIQSWSPAQHHPIFLATGTSAQQLDASFSTNASLEFFELDFTEPCLDMKSCGSFTSSHRYHKLVWGPHGMDDSGHPSGVLIAGGENGDVILYDPAKIMAGESDVIIAESDRHTGPVRALDINPFQTNLVASGGNESEIYIWDLNNFGSPMTPGPKTQPVEDISFVSWNRQVQHILASANPSGRASVWDLRKNDLIIKVSDHSNRMHCSGLAWNPEVATQLILASEDDRMPVIQMWDLRFATSPLKILENHTRGVLSIAWSMADPELLLSCGKDSRILCWNPNTAEVLYELPTSSQWCFDIQWCPRNPAVLSAAGFDGHIDIFSIMGGSSQAQSQRHADQISTSFGNMDPFGTGQTLPPLQLPQAAAPSATITQMKKPPKWIRRPVAASFGFGGKLVSLENPKPNPQQPQQHGPHVVHISQVVTETDFLKRSDQLQATLNTGTFVDFCQGKIGAAVNEFEKTLWSFLKANFESDVRSKYLELLGYNKEELALKISAALEEKPSDPIQVELPASASLQPVVDLSLLPPTDNPEAAFDLIAASNLLTEATPEPQSDREATEVEEPEVAADFQDDASDEPKEMEELEEEEIPLEEDKTAPVEEESVSAPKEPTEAPAPTPAETGISLSTSQDVDGLITQALLTGNFEGAVELCLHDNRMADSIILAIAGGPELLEKTQKKYFTKTHSKITKLISAVVMKDWHDILQTCELQNWKEALAAVMTYARPEEFSSLCDLLGGRLEAAENIQLRAQACLCYICAGNIEKLVSCWSRAQDGHCPLSLQDLVEKVVVLQRAVEVTQKSGPAAIGILLAEKMSQYANLLASQGSLSTAIKYLPDNTNQVAIQQLRERLSRALGQQAAAPSASTHVRKAQPATAQPLPQHSFTPIQPAMVPRPAAPAPVPVPTPAASAPAHPQYYQPVRAASTVTSWSNQTPTALPNVPLPLQVGNAPEHKAEPINPVYGMPPPGSSAPPPASSTPAYISHQYQRPQNGWNDPPALMRASKKKPVLENYTPPAPITAPIMAPLGADPQAQPVSSGAPQAMVQGQHGAQVPYSGMHQQQFAPPAVNQVMPNTSVEGAPGAPTGDVIQPLQSIPTEKIMKKPIPDEHVVLKTTFEGLIQKCLAVATDPQTRRKLDDANKRLEALYDKLREQTLSPAIVGGLHNMARSIETRCYTEGLNIHTHIVSSSNFSETSAFMPVLKVVLTQANKLGV